MSRRQRSDDVAAGGLARVGVLSQGGRSRPPPSILPFGRSLVARRGPGDRRPTRAAVAGRAMTCTSIPAAPASRTVADGGAAAEELLPSGAAAGTKDDLGHLSFRWAHQCSHRVVGLGSGPSGAELLRQFSQRGEPAVGLVWVSGGRVDDVRSALSRAAIRVARRKTTSVSRAAVTPTKTRSAVCQTRSGRER